MHSRIRVALVEDDSRTRAEIRRVVEADDGLALAGAFGTAESALEKIPGLVREGLDVVVADLELPGMDGIALATAVRAIEGAPEVLMLTAFASADRVFQAIRTGAAGYLVKRDVAARLGSAVREVHAGGVVIEPRLAKMFWNLFEAERGRAATDPYGLNETERDVLGFVARGLSNVEVSGVAGLPARRVKTALEGAYKKMGVRSRVEAVVLAVRVGIVRP